MYHNNNLTNYQSNNQQFDISQAQENDNSFVRRNSFTDQSSLPSITNLNQNVKELSSIESVVQFDNNGIIVNKNEETISENVCPPVAANVEITSDTKPMIKNTPPSISAPTLQKYLLN